MVIQIFVMHYCTAMPGSSCDNYSALLVSNCRMLGARPSIQPEVMLISKKKRLAQEFVTRIHVPKSCYEFVTRQNILGVRAIIKVSNHRSRASR